MTKFEPFRRVVVLDERTVGETQLNQHVWSDDYFEEEGHEDEVIAAPRKKEPLRTSKENESEERRTGGSRFQVPLPQ